MLKIKQIYILILERWYGNKWEEVMVTLFQVKFIMIFIYCIYMKSYFKVPMLSLSTN